MKELVSDEELRRIDKAGWIPGIGVIVRMARELLSRRRGEWICKSCGLKQDPAQQDSDGGIPW
jgi:hypothetical protein